MKIAIVGTGAMGSLFAALLSPFADILMIGSWTEGLKAARDPGLTLRHLDDSESRHVVFATAEVSGVEGCDIALIVVKGWQTARAAALTKSALKPGGLAITLQNGLGNLEIIASAVGVGRAVQGVTSEGSTLLGPGRVRHAGRGHTYFASNDGNRNRLEAVAGLFRAAGLSASVVEDAKSLIWGKLAVNAGINPLTALLQVPNGYLAEHNRTLDLMHRAANEVAAVAAQLGIMLPYEDPAAQATAVARATARNRSSMAQDIARGNPTEIEQICGAVSRMGKLVNVPTPVNEALLHLVTTQVTQGEWRGAIGDIPSDLQPLFLYLSSREISNESNRKD